MTELSPELIEVIAQRFKALSEPARLRILNELRDGEASVSEIMAATGLAQANVSKHLQLLHSLGFVSRRKEAQQVYYALAGRDVFRLCDIMCARLDRETAARRKLIG